MSAVFAVSGVALLVTVCTMLLVWLVSVMRRDASIVDVFWGLGFVLIAAAACAVGSGFSPRKFLVLTLTALWGLRLSAYLLWRNWGNEEDYRYRAMRARHGERFWLVSLYSVFALQGILMWVISLPVQVALAAPVPARLTWLDGFGALVWAAGWLCESIGDWQLARFKAAPAHRGQVMDRGLWAYTRHPNYFGDALLWWGLFLIACATPSGPWTIISPVAMTLLLLRISGVPLLERRLVKTRPEYRAYVRRTSSFVPWFPKRG